MTTELKDLKALLDKADDYRPGLGIPEPPDEDEVARCIQTLLARQCLYPGQNQKLTRVYSIMACCEYQDFFSRYFAAMGLEFHYDPRTRMVSLRVPSGDRKRHDWQSSRLKKDETLVLFVLKLAYEEGFHANEMDEAGGVGVTTDDILDKLDAVAGQRIEENRLATIIEMLRRKGVVSPGDFDPVERLRPLTILQGIEVACPESHMRLIAEWAERQPQDGAKTDETADADGEDADNV